jgi:predicted RNase H-like HicB family nuclease
MNMNAKQLIAAVAALTALTAATSAFADQNETRVTSGKTRAEVIAELQQAQQDGTASSYSFVGNTNPAAAAGNAAHAQSNNAIPTGKTRAEVVAELKQSDSSSTPTGFVAFDKPTTNSNGTPNTAVAHK